MKQDCIFCGLEEGIERSVVAHHGDFQVILDQFPVNFGHCLIVPERHVESLDGLSDEEFQQLRDVIDQAKKVAGQEELREKYREILNNPISDKSREFCEEVLEQNPREPDGFNIGINDGEAAGRTIDHLHVQMIPRYKGDVENPTGGIRNVIPGKADYTE